MEPVSLYRRVDLDLPVEDLWELIADPAQLAGWLGDEVDLDITPGSTGTMVDDGTRRIVHIGRVDHQRAVGFTWWDQDDPTSPSSVALEIVALPGRRSRLEITETLAPSASTDRRADTSAETIAANRLRWEVRVCMLWACTVVAALVP